MTHAELIRFIREVLPRDIGTFVFVVERQPGNLLVSFLGRQAIEDEERVSRELLASWRDRGPSDVVLETSWQTLPCDLDALAKQVVVAWNRFQRGSSRGAFDEPSLDVFVDVLLQVGVLDGERDRCASSAPEAARRNLRDRALLWARHIEQGHTVGFSFASRGRFV